MFKKLFFWTSALIIAHQAQAQTASGSWYGKADVAAQGSYSNYLTELILKQKGNEVEGVFGYYFKDTYQSFFVRGKYNPTTREVTIPNLPMLLYASSSRNGIECPMSFVGKLMVSQAKSTMNGSFYASEKYKYTCPELKVNFTMDRTEGTATEVLRNMAVGQRFWKPQEEDVVVEQVKKDTTQRVEEIAVVAEQTPANTEKKPVVAANTVPRVDIPVSKPVSPAANNGATIAVTPKFEELLKEAFSKRTKVYSKDLEVDADSIRITFYDNGDIDGDTISVFLNGAPVLANQMITDRGTNIYVKLDSMKTVNEISMFAQNLGKYPPNTALMVVTDGTTRYEVFLSSSLTQTATVRIVRKKRTSETHRLKLK